VCVKQDRSVSRVLLVHQVHQRTALGELNTETKRIHKLCGLRSNLLIFNRSAIHGLLAWSFAIDNDQIRQHNNKHKHWRNKMAASKSLTTAEIEKVLHYIANHKFSQRNRAIFMMTAMAGLRVGEVSDLKISDVRNADGTVKSEIYLAAERVKYNNARTVYVSTRLQEELAAYIASHFWMYDSQPLFFTQKNMRRGFTANTLTQHFYWLYKNAGVTGASSHAGRKTFLTSLASQGISVFVLASLAGHKSIQTTQKYVTVNDDMKRKAVELV
jgi:integrase/recombinase XerD